MRDNYTSIIKSTGSKSLMVVLLAFILLLSLQCSIFACLPTATWYPYTGITVNDSQTLPASGSAFCFMNPVQFSITASDQDFLDFDGIPYYIDDSLTYTWTGTPSGFGTHTGSSFIWTTSRSGNYTITCVIDDVADLMGFTGSRNDPPVTRVINLSLVRFVQMDGPTMLLLNQAGQFTATTSPVGHGSMVCWNAPGANPSQGQGATFTTQWSTPGTKTVETYMIDSLGHTTPGATYRVGVGNIIYVDVANGSNYNTGMSWGDAVESIDKAINIALPGQEVWVATGTYPFMPFSYDIFEMKEGVSFYGGFTGTETARNQRDWVAHPVIIDQERTVDTVISFPAGITSATVLDGFTIRRGYYWGITCFGSSPTITHNIIRDNGILNPTGAGGGGICCVESAAPLIADNLIVNNKSNGVYCFAGPATIVNNTISDNEGEGWRDAGIFAADSYSTIANNIITGNLTGILRLDIDEYGICPALYSNCVYGNVADNYLDLSPGATDIQTDPMFIDSDYHLSCESPCINGGSLVDSSQNPLPVGLIDIYEQTRVQNGAVDIGAIESVPCIKATVTDVTTSKADGFYKAGEDIDIAVTFSQNVTVAGGTPTLALNTGRTVNYTSGSGTNILTFRYTVQAGDTSSDLDYAAANSLAAVGATIRDAGGLDAILTLATPGAEHSISDNQAIVIDTTAPTATVSRVDGLTTPVNTSPINFRIVFSEIVNNFDSSDVTITNGTAGTLTTSDNITYTLPVTPSASGTVTCSVAASKCYDRASNNNTASNVVSVVYDVTAPSAAIASPAENTLHKVAGAVNVKIGVTAADAASGVSAVKVRISSGQWQDAAYDSATQKWWYNGWNPSTASSYVIDAQSFDNANNSSSIVSRTVTLTNVTAKYVDKNATGTPHDGSSWSNAYLTIQEGINAASAGQEVWVADGIYPVASVVLKNEVGLYGGFTGAGTTPEVYRELRNWVANISDIDGDSGYGNLVIVPDYASETTVIDGFTIENATINGISCGGSSCPVISHNVITRSLRAGIYCGYFSYPTISKNTILDCIGDSTTRDGLGIYCDRSDAIITDNIVTGSKAASGYIDMASSVFFNSCSPTLRGNRIVGYGIRSYYEDYWCSPIIENNVIVGGGIVLDIGSPTVINNTVTGSRYGISSYGDSGTVIKNNIFAYNYYGVSIYSGSYGYNCVYGNITANYNGTPVGTGDISVDPLLANVVYGNPHLLPTSPCVDAGYDGAAPIGTDIDGESRSVNAKPNANVIDIGADEWNGVTDYTNTPGVVIRVATNGDDHNDGLSWSKPKATINSAVAAAAALGGEVWVKEGTYNQHMQIAGGMSIYGGFHGDETSRSQRNPSTHVTILSASDNDRIVRIDGGYRSEFDGFTITNPGNGQDIGGGGVICVGGIYNRISNNIFQNNYEYGAGGAIYIAELSPSTMIIDGNKFFNNTAYYIGGAILAYGDNTNTLILNNVFAENIAQNKYYADASGGGAICALDGKATIANNTFAGNQSLENGYGGNGGAISTFSQECQILNNIFYGNTVCSGQLGWSVYIDGDSTNNPISYCNAYNPSSDNLPDHHFYYSYYPDDLGSGMTYVDPLFTNTSGQSKTTWDYHLATGSPCIDKAPMLTVASPNQALPTKDIEGNTRPIDIPSVGNNGSNYTDLGAYEKQ